MRAALKIVPIIVFLIACSTEMKNMNVHRAYLTNGTFYLNVKRSSDTLRFQSERNDKIRFIEKMWTITDDSIFQEDSRGLSYCLGEDRRKYILRNDTLILWTNIKNTNNEPRLNEKVSIEHYLVLKSTNNDLELIDLNTSKMGDRSNEIRTDIQLR